MKLRTTEGDEEEIVLFVLIPQCSHCRARIREELMRCGYWERVEIGYPLAEGSAVSLVYRKGKFPEVDYWKLAKAAKTRLDRLGYRVL